LFSMIDSFRERLLHGTLLLITVVVVSCIFVSAAVNRRFSRDKKMP
jgi:hypothetical protein